MLSENLHKTEDGFLICKNVPLARPGELVYNAAELPTFEADNGRITAVRDAADILDKETMQSFEGKTVSYLHPKEQEINSKNWKTHAVGYTFNVRAGDGEYSNLLVADLLINDEKAITAITTRGLREVSLGYEALYTQEGKGRVRQRKIKGNHVALVPRGRCGALCAIQDHAAPTQMEIPTMSMKEKLLALVSKINDADLEDDNTATKTVDQKSIDKLQKTVDDLTKVQAKTGEVLKGIVDALAEISKTGDTKIETEAEKKAREALEAQKTSDAEAKKVADATAIAADLPLAEILAPGITASATMKVDALKTAYKTTDGKVAIDAFTGGKEVDYTNDADVNMTFVGAANLLKATRKGAQAAVTHVSLDQLSIHKPQAMTPAAFNDLAAAHWNKQSA